MAEKDDAPARVQWTQTPAGKRKMSAIHRRAWKRRRQKARDDRKQQQRDAARKPTRSSSHSSNHVSRRPTHAASRGPAASPSSNGIPADHVAYLLGRVEGFIEHYARSANLPEQALTARLGEILVSKAQR